MIKPRQTHRTTAKYIKHYQIISEIDVPATAPA
jgi:hypothetical protein